MDLKEWLTKTVEHLTSSTDFEITEDVMVEYISYTINIPSKTAGRIIGRHGGTINALRTLAFAMGIHHFQTKVKVTVEAQV